VDRSDIKIRIAREGDLSAILEIYNSVIEEGDFTADLDIYTLEQRREWFRKYNDEKYGIYVLEKFNIVLGYFYFSPWRSGREALKSIAEISFYIDKNARGKGYGDLILSFAMKEAEVKKYTHLLAILLDINEQSKNLLEKWGFFVMGNLPDIAKLKNRRAGQYLMMKDLRII
jgi:L-amino acid N-acyltransferase YncA